jgi:O-antigen/teichoic acid export membrane protein
MVWGLIIGAIFEVTISFIFIKPRPTFGLNKLKFKLIVKRGRWVNASLIFNYLIEQIDNGFVGKFINEGALGIYQVAYKISTLPITEVSQVVGRVTFPMITAIRDDVQRVKNVFIKTWITSVIIIAPISAVLFFYPENIVRLILGDKWMDVSIILKYLAIFGFFRSIILVPNSLFNGFKKQDWVAKSAFLEFIVLLILLYPMIKLFGVIGAIYANIISLVFTTPLVFYYFRKILY